jgi:ribose 5-phosphate isomerase B
MKVYFASDHAGFEMKKALVGQARALGHEVEDVGAAQYNAEDDYPDFIAPCAQKVAAEEGSFGIILGKSGQGEAMVANRVKGIRAAVYYGGSTELITLTREHNNANVLSLGAGFLTPEEAGAVVERFLSTSFSHDDRHVRRLAKF